MRSLRNLRHVSPPRTTSLHVTAVRFGTGNHKPTNTQFHGQRGLPAFIYGTAWKKDQTKALVKEALAAGFRRFDTAAQPKHYEEELVGEALREAILEGTVKRNGIYIQTKFTPPAGQDLKNMPYDPEARLSDQVNLSVSRSLRKFHPTRKYISHMTYLDSLLLHSPYPTVEETLRIWFHLEAFVPKRTPRIGISNVDLPTLQAICEHPKVKVKPSIVQNRFHAETGYDVSLRAFCRKDGIEYQAFWTLTGNLELLESKAVRALAQAAKIGKPVALYALVMDLDILVLNGTTSAEHMREDLEGMRIVGTWAEKHSEEWKTIRADFRETIGDEAPWHNDPGFRGLWRT